MSPLPSLPSRDVRFERREARRDHYDDLRAELSPVFATRTRAEWLDVLQRHQVPCAPVNRSGEAIEDPQLVHLSLIDTVEEPDVELLPQIRPPSHVDGSPLPPAARAPFRCEHTDEVIGGLHAAHHAGTEGPS